MTDFDVEKEGVLPVERNRNMKTLLLLIILIIGIVAIWQFVLMDQKVSDPQLAEELVNTSTWLVSLSSGTNVGVDAVLNGEECTDRTGLNKCLEEMAFKVNTTTYTQEEIDNIRRCNDFFPELVDACIVKEILPLCKIKQDEYFDKCRGFSL